MLRLKVGDTLRVEQGGRLVEARWATSYPPPHTSHLTPDTLHLSDK